MKKPIAGFPDDFGSNLSKLMKEIEASSNSLSLLKRSLPQESLFSAVQVAMSGTTAFTAFQDELRRRAEDLARFPRVLEEQQRMFDGLRSMNLFSSQLLTVTSTGTLAALIEARHVKSVLSPVWDYMPKEGEELTEAEVQQDAQGLGVFLSQLWAKMPHLSTEFKLSFLLAILIAWIQILSQQGAATEKTLIAIQKSVAEIAEQLKQQPVPMHETVRPQFVVTTRTRVRQTRKSDSEIVGTLNLGQVAELLKDRGMKLKVRYFDLRRGEEQEGWVLKKYLRRVQMANAKVAKKL